MPGFILSADEMSENSIKSLYEGGPTFEGQDRIIFHQIHVYHGVGACKCYEGKEAGYQGGLRGPR